MNQMHSCFTISGGPASPMSLGSTTGKFLAQATAYAVDAWQRSVLFADVMRQRGNQYQAHLQERAPNVLDFGAELILDGRTLPRPVNYGLVRIDVPGDLESARDRTDGHDPGRKRPFVVVDPRAGHGPGIGGFKRDSEIGAALRAGHPCYFVGFLPDPVPGQTIEDVMHAEAAFLEKVIELHPDSPGRPAVIGNCQAGWQVLMTAAMRPDLFGPIIVAGAPVSYWQGWRGKNPMRYSGGLLGGSWLTALTSDLGDGRFDGVARAAESVRAERAPVVADNPFWQMQNAVSNAIETSLDCYRDMRDAAVEQIFETVYSTPWLQAFAGLPPHRDSEANTTLNAPGDTQARETSIVAGPARLRHDMTEGGLVEASIRALLYVRRMHGEADERRFNLAREMLSSLSDQGILSFKHVVREQAALLRLDAEAAIDALPGMLANVPLAEIEAAARDIDKLSTTLPLDDHERADLARVLTMFESASKRKMARRIEARQQVE